MLILVGCSTGAESSEHVEIPWTAPQDIVEARTSSSSAFNYDESKVPEFSLPDPLLSDEGIQISSPEAWRSSRREELLEIFRNEVYGRRPSTNYELSFDLLKEDPKAFEGKAIARELTATVRIDERSYSFPFVVFLPNQRSGKVPAVVHINNRYFTPLDTVLSRHDPFFAARTLIDRGYASASFHTSDVDPDSADGYPHGIRSFFADGKEPAEEAWRSLSAWGWAASRVLDYLEGAEEVDSENVAIVGHSRGGKTSLWAAAEDERFAIAYSNNSGCGGAALSRRVYGETIDRITNAFPHWFAPALTKYSGRESDLPIDQHELFALIAPRGVYVTSANEDLWADPKGEYEALFASRKVFELLGKESIDQAEMPSLDKPRHQGMTGYHVRSGGHNLTQTDWDWFLDFADGILK